MLITVRKSMIVLHRIGLLRQRLIQGFTRRGLIISSLTFFSHRY